MIRPPPSSTRTSTPFTSTSLCRSTGSFRMYKPLIVTVFLAVLLPLSARGAETDCHYQLRADIELDGDAVELHSDAGRYRLDGDRLWRDGDELNRSEEHTSELQSLMRISYAVFCLKKKKTKEN